MFSVTKALSDSEPSLLMQVKFILLRCLVICLDALISVKPIEGKFVFVIGCGNSGSTLLTDRLSRNHCFLTIPRETGMFVTPAPAFWQARFLLWLRQLCQSQGRQFVLEKTPKHVQCMSHILRVIPQAKFIHIVRSPVDNVSSLKKRYGDFEFALSRYLADNARIPMHISDDSTLVIRYEHLVTNPEVVARNISTFLSHEVRLSGATSTESFLINDEGSSLVALRQKQISGEIRRNINGGLGELSSDEVLTILQATKDIQSALGYVYNPRGELVEFGS